MNRPSIDQPSDLWLVDGSFRDVYIQGTGAQDWESLLTVARSYTHRYSRDGVAMTLPEVVSVFEDREHSHLLCIEAGPVKVHCHFFSLEDIELDIDPREVSSSAEHLEVLDLLERLSAATGKDVLVTSENSRELVLLRYESSARKWHVGGPPAASEA